MVERSNAAWLSALQGPPRDREAALAELRLTLLDALRAFLAKQALSGEEARQLAEDCAQDSLILIEAKLAGFRGESRFTTWAYAIAARVALGELRRRRWRRAALEKAELGGALPDWPIDPPGPERSLQQRQAWALLIEAIDHALTPLQRKALVAHAFQDMPLDLVAEWLGSNRNSLYKLIHDARKRLKAALSAKGVTQADLAAAFGDGWIVQNPSERSKV